MAKDLRSFIAQVMRTMPGAIKQVPHPVDRKFGITGMAARYAEQNEYPALFFDQVEGADIPCIINLTATYDRLALALDATPFTMVQNYGERLRNPIPPVYVERDQAPVKEIVIKGDDVDLTKLPIPWHNELDGGPYITAGTLIMRDPETGEVNSGLYRHHVWGPKEMGVWFIDTHHGAYLYRRYEAMNKPAPIAIVIGHHPGYVMGAVSRLPGIGGEFAAAGALMGEPLALVQAETVDLPVPAWAEIVIEGEVLPHERREEGPFAEWPGLYMAEGPKPVIKVKCITMRKNAVYYDVFASNREHLTLGSLPRMGSIYRNVKQVVPGVTAVNVPAHSRMHCYVSIKKESNAEVKKAAFAALNTEPENLKAVVVVDDDINVFNDGEVLWAIGTRFDAVKDLLVIPDWSGPGGLLPPGWEFFEDGSKQAKMISAMVIDATKPAPPTPYPPRSRVPAAVVKAADTAKVQDFKGWPGLESSLAASGSGQGRE